MTVELRRAPMRIGTIVGPIRVVTLFAVLAAVVVVMKAAAPLNDWALLLLAVIVAGGLDLAGVHLARWRNRDRAGWRPGLDMHAADLDPGTWIATPLDQRTPSRYESYRLGLGTRAAPKRATQVHSICGLIDSPQTGHVELTLADGQVYTLRGDAPIHTLYVEHIRR